MLILGVIAMFSEHFTSLSKETLILNGSTDNEGPVSPSIQSEELRKVTFDWM